MLKVTARTVSSGMENEGSRKLPDMFAVARYVDHHLIELQETLKSIHSIMPNESREVRAQEIMDGVCQEIKETQELTSRLKLELENQLAASRKERESLTATNNAVEEGLLQIESTLKNYGYDGSNMPSDVPDTESDCESVYSEEDLESSVVLAHEEKKVSSPLNDFSQLSTSISNVDTPLLFRSVRSSHSSVKSLKTPEIKITSPCGLRCNPYMSGSPNSLAFYTTPCIQSCISNNELKKGESCGREPKKLIKPERPILSKTTYEILGEEPPL